MMTTKIDGEDTVRTRTNKGQRETFRTKKLGANKNGEFVNKSERLHTTKKFQARASVQKKKPLEPIAKIEWPEHLCEKCGELITDLTQALSDKTTGNPVHFECILSFLKNSEELKEKEEVVYIGNGNFAVVYFENPRVRSSFKIVKLIEWEDTDKEYAWRNEVANLGSST